VLAALGIVVGAASVLVGSARGDVGSLGVLPWIFTAVVLVAAIATIVLALVRAPGRVLFRLVMAAALVLALQLVLSGGGLTA
jgi:hypothetical protein